MFMISFVYVCSKFYMICYYSAANKGYHNCCPMWHEENNWAVIRRQLIYETAISVISHPPTKPHSHCDPITVLYTQEGLGHTLLNIKSRINPLKVTQT
mgnify:CR=1 FL=1